MSAPVASKRKRNSKEASADQSDDENRKRGRPRVDRSDESAADRRRTQIRMAQRAYRQRKESTLDELRTQVSDLTSKLTLMSKAFGECREHLAASGLGREQLRILRQTSERFESIHGAAEHSDESSPPGLTESSQGSSAESPQNREFTEVPVGPTYVAEWIDSSALGYRPTQPTARDVGMGYVHMQDLSTALSPRVSMLQEPQLSPSLPAPRSYSTKELTFGRYLHRASNERGLQLLLEPERYPVSYKRVFELSLLIRDHKGMVASMRRGLARTANSDFHQVDSRVHIGGAGTHYPRRDPSGVMRPRKEVFNIGVVGPQALTVLDDAAQTGLSIDMAVDVAGFEGEWFDPYDVEGYLAEKGISLDPASPYAVIELPSRPHFSPLEVLSSLDHEQVKELNEFDDRSEDMYGMSVQDLSGSGFDSLDESSLSPSHLPELDIVKRPYPMATPMRDRTGSNILRSYATPQSEGATRTMIVDVAKFVKALIVTGRCISRSPGFRRHDVDRALELAAFEPYPSVLTA